MFTAHAQPAAEFYKGKTISLQVGFGTGGEDDLWARAISRHIGNHIPGKPTMVVQHMPGSGGLLVANRLYNAAAKDGTVVGMINRGIPFEPLLGGQGTKFDALKFHYVGSPGRDTTVCAARKDSEVQTLQDLYTKELTVGGTGSGADTAIYPQFLSALLGMKFKLVEGYGSSQGVLLAMERGEVQGICQSLSSLRGSRPEWFASGKLKVLFNTERHLVPGLNAPSVFEFAKTEEQRRILSLYTSSVEFGRPIVAPPNVPKERVAALRKALA
ncbi:MAG: Bug family tripartite tricarboxylate transporter substrate binding protein, partial [Gammaproteobacteria bacterium]